MLVLKRIMVLAMAIVSLFFASGKSAYADTYAAYDFPIICAEKQKSGTLRIMSYNIRSGDVNGTKVADRLGIGVRQILEVMPDSVGVQEATPAWMKALDRRLCLYDWVGVDRDHGNDPRKSGESCPIFYLKSRLALVDSGNFWISETPDEPSYGPGAACRRICTWAKLRNRFTGEAYVHVNTHFDHVSQAARTQGGRIVSQYIRDHFSDVPVVFTADMNATEAEDVYATMTQDLSDTRHTAEDAVVYGTFHGGKDPALRSDYYIDYVLCSDAFDAAAYRTVTKGVDGRFTSDHFPIYADLQYAKGS